MNKQPEQGEALKACPFGCVSEIAPRAVFGEVYYQCSVCGCRGPTAHKSFDRAWLLWNRRPPATEPGAGQTSQAPSQPAAGVKRYSRASKLCSWDDSGMSVDAIGDYVLASDYDSLAARLSQAERELGAERSAHDTMRDHDLHVTRAAQKLERELAVAREALAEADRYLSSNNLNYIGSGSQLHRQIKAALSTQPAEVSK